MYTLFNVIAMVESIDNPYAMRFERDYYEKRQPDRFDQSTIARIKKANGCSTETAETIYCTSYGCAQIMGFNLYGPDHLYTKYVAAFLNTKADQEIEFWKFVNKNGINMKVSALADSRDNRVTFGVKYNGDGPGYATAIEQRGLKALGIDYA